MERFEIDTWYLQRQFIPNQQELLKYYKDMHKCQVVFELDDRSPISREKMCIRSACLIVRWTKRFVNVTTDYLADQYRHPDQDVKSGTEYHLRRQMADLQALRRTGQQATGGWGGVSATLEIWS